MLEVRGVDSRELSGEREERDPDDSKFGTLESGLRA